MTEQLEAELRATLQERAAQVPAAKVARLRHLDYHPRTRVIRPPIAVGALAGAGATAAAVALVTLGAGASNAFAGWKATPTKVAPAHLAAALADCQSHSPVAGLTPVVSDTRGPFTMSVYADSNQSATCISGPSFTAVSGSMSSSPVSVPAGQILLRTSHTSRDSQAYSFSEGRTGTGVNGVTLILEDGTQVQATVDNGWFVAWWPGSHDVKSAQITTPDGVHTQTFDPNRTPTPPAHGSGYSEGGFSGGAKGQTESSSGSVSG